MNQIDIYLHKKLVITLSYWYFKKRQQDFQCSVALKDHLLSADDKKLVANYSDSKIDPLGA